MNEGASWGRSLAKAFRDQWVRLAKKAKIKTCATPVIMHHHTKFDQLTESAVALAIGMENLINAELSVAVAEILLSLIKATSSF